MDLTPDNLTLDTDGLIHIVDWDQLQMAPPEFDLRWLLSPGRYDVALDAYESAGGSAGLDPWMFAFYFHRRCLAEELACNVAAILLPDRTDQQDLDDISQIESIAWAFDGGMQSWISEVENGLAARREWS
jgi:thiamine kinase-like enzyme